MMFQVVAAFAVLTISLVQCQPSHFYAFGTTAGDTDVPERDDGSYGPVTLTYGWRFYDNLYNQMWINYNGPISFNGEWSPTSGQLYPNPSGAAAAVPWQLDIDFTDADAQLWYRQSEDQADLDRATNDISACVPVADCQAISVVVITMWGFKAFGAYTDGQKNDLQVVMMTGQSEGGKYCFFTQFNYGRMEWISRSAMRSPASIGFNAGDGIRGFALPGSRTQAVRDLNTGSNIHTPGRWMYINGHATTDDMTTDEYGFFSVGGLEGNGEIIGCDNPNGLSLLHLCDDPHVLVNVIGLDLPICFDFMGYDGAIYILIEDEHTGVALNGRIFTTEDMRQQRSYFNEIFISNGDDTIHCSMHDIILNGETHTWETITSHAVGQMSISVQQPGTVVIRIGNGIEVTIILDSEQVVDHLDMFLSKSSGLSEATKGVIGEFLFKEASVEQLNSDGDQGQLFFPGTGRSARASISHRHTLAGERISCWEPDSDQVDQLMDRSINSYLVSHISHRQL